MIALEYVKKIEIIDKIIDIVKNSKVLDIDKDVKDFEEKHFHFLEENYFNTSENDDYNEKIKEFKSQNPMNNSFYKKYSRSVVRTNANLETFLEKYNENDAKTLGIDKLVEVNKKLEDFMFNDEERSLSELRQLLEDYKNTFNNIQVLKGVYSSLYDHKELPSGYKDFELTLYTNDPRVDIFSSRILSLKLLYNIILKIKNIPEEKNNSLIVLKAEKETNEYYRLSGVSDVISEMYFLIKEWTKSYNPESNNDENMSMEHLHEIKVKISSLVEKNDINSLTGDKYFEIIKRALKSLEIEGCSNILLYSENIQISESLPEVQIGVKEKKSLSNTKDKVSNLIPPSPSSISNIENPSPVLLNSSPITDQKSAEIILKKGLTLMSLKKHVEAIECFDNAIELYPDYAEAYNFKSNAYIQLSDFSTAIKFADKAISINPNLKEAYINKGAAFFSRRQHDKALNQYIKAIELDKSYSEGYFNLGSCLMMMDGKTSDAIKAFSKAIELNPNYAAAYYNRACSYISIEDTEKSLMDLESAIKLDKSFKNMLKFDSDFSILQDETKFKKLIS